MPIEPEEAQNAHSCITDISMPAAQLIPLINRCALRLCMRINLRYCLKARGSIILPDVYERGRTKGEICLSFRTLRMIILIFYIVNVRERENGGLAIRHAGQFGGPALNFNEPERSENNAAREFCPAWHTRSLNNFFFTSITRRERERVLTVIKMSSVLRWEIDNSV